MMSIEKLLEDLRGGMPGAEGIVRQAVEVEQRDQENLEAELERQTEADQIEAAREAERDRARAQEQRLDRFREDVPAAEALGVDVSGMGKDRAALVRFDSWQAQTRQQLDDLDAAHERALIALGAPAVTQQDLDKLVAADTSGLLAWWKGTKQGPAPDVQTFRRQQLEQKLQADGHEAEVARGALAALEAEIADLRNGISILASRKERVVRLALAESGSAKVAEYRAAVDRVVELGAELAGLARVANIPDFARIIGDLKIEAPRFGSIRQTTTVPERMLFLREGPWRNFMRQLATDPRAELPDGSRGDAV